MSNPSKLHKSRFAAAVKLFTKLKIAASKPGNMLLYGAEQYPADAIVIREDRIHVKMGDSCTVVWFDFESGYDDGCYDTIAEYEASVRAEFSVVRVVKW